MSISIPTNYLKAALLVAAKNDIRYYLDAVNIIYKGGDVVRLESTNGSSAWVHEFKFAADPNLQPFSILASRDALEAACKLHKTHVVVTASNVGGIPAVVDGRFPDISRVFPTDLTSVTNGVYDPEITLALQKAARMVQGKYGVFWFFGTTVGGSCLCIVNTNHKFIGFAMPLRVETDLSKITLPSPN